MKQRKFAITHGKSFLSIVIYLFDGDDLIFVKMRDFLFQVKVERVTSQSQRNRKGDRDGEVVRVVTGRTNFRAELERSI